VGSVEQPVITARISAACCTAHATAAWNEAAVGSEGRPPEPSRQCDLEPSRRQPRCLHPRRPPPPGHHKGGQNAKNPWLTKGFSWRLIRAFALVAHLRASQGTTVAIRHRNVSVFGINAGGNPLFRLLLKSDSETSCTASFEAFVRPKVALPMTAPVPSVARRAAEGPVAARST
jgi:hypothetical protein